MTTDNTFKELGTQALNDYDALLRKYNQLAAEHEKTTHKLSELESVAEPMYDEYGKIQTKFELERSLRAAAESYASKVVKDNKKIKRQSAMLQAQMSSLKPIAIDIDIDEPINSEENRIEELNATISELQNEIADYKNELAKKEEEFGILSAEVDSYIAEKEEYRMKYETLEKQVSSQTITFQQQQRELRSLKRVSTLAYTDYTSLEERYETEKALRIKAEIYARQLQRKRNSMVDQKRASINDGVSTDDESKSLIAENDRLHTEWTTQESEYISQIEDLQRELKESSSHSTIESLEEKLDAVKEDLQRVAEELETLKHEKKHLSETVAKMEKERTEFMNIPLPPPPPPPPGPKAGISHLLFSKKKKKEQQTKKVVGNEAVNNVAMQSAIEEMMARIKSGRPTAGLKKVDMNSRPEDLSPDEEEGGAMKEMHKYLVDMKKKRAPATAPKPSRAIDDELAQKFKMIGQRSRSNSVDSILTPREPTTTKFTKQGSLDTGHSLAPVPTPRPRLAPVNSTSNGASSELAERLNARLRRIPDAKDEDSIPDDNRENHVPGTKDENEDKGSENSNN